MVHLSFHQNNCFCEVVMSLCYIAKFKIRLHFIVSCASSFRFVYTIPCLENIQLRRFSTSSTTLYKDSSTRAFRMEGQNTCGNDKEWIINLTSSFPTRWL